MCHLMDLEIYCFYLQNRNKIDQFMIRRVANSSITFKLSLSKMVTRIVVVVIALLLFPKVFPLGKKFRLKMLLLR